MIKTNSTDIHLTPESHQRLANLCGANNEHIRQLEQYLEVSIHNHGHHFQVSGETANIKKSEELLKKLYKMTETQEILTPAKVHLLLQDQLPNAASNRSVAEVTFKNKAGEIRGHTPNQRLYMQNISRYDINFAIGPAGTGKTYLAVACAVAALEAQKVQRVILVRPAVEAGERLGFLPGDLTEKIEPYLRPLYDALFEMLGAERVQKYLEQNIIELAPLAYMRGRTLNDSFVILDEAQNTTTEQMKMFLTRIGFGSKAVITGDVTQVDLPKERKSGLVEATEVLKDIPDICFSYFESRDVVRHTLVQRIIEAYDVFLKKISSSFK